MRIILKLGRDRNGNKVLKISPVHSPKRGFSIETNGNLPKTHRMAQKDLDLRVALALRQGLG